MTTLGAGTRALQVPGVHDRRRARPSALWLAAALLAPTFLFLLVFTYWPLLAPSWAPSSAGPRPVRPRAGSARRTTGTSGGTRCSVSGGGGEEREDVR